VTGTPHRHEAAAPCQAALGAASILRGVSIMRSLMRCAALVSIAATPPQVQKISISDRIIVATAEGGAAVGPFFVDGAEPGDVIVISIEKLEPNRLTGTSASVMTPNAIVPGDPGTRGSLVKWTIDKEQGIVRLESQRVIANVARYDLPIYEFPLEPMVGAIATAPGDHDARSTVAIAGAGTRVLLPVYEKGALLTFSHGLARPAHGDVTGSGIETTLDVTFSVEVVKKKRWIEWPRLETSDYIGAVATASTLHDALRHATTELHRWMADEFGFSERSLSIFLGPAIEYEVASLAGPSFTVVARVRRAYIPKTTSAP
jgi:acetamidase/formamidase